MIYKNWLCWLVAKPIITKKLYKSIYFVFLVAQYKAKKIPNKIKYAYIIANKSIFFLSIIFKKI